MKRFLVVLFALGLIVAFSAPAAATDVKFSGSYYIVGYHDDNHALNKDGASSQFYAQRLRVSTVFKVAEGLTLTTRFDAMERVWQGTRIGGTGTEAERNISWERAYVTFKTGIGNLSAGYMQCGTWGTVFADGAYSQPRIKYVGAVDNLILLALLQKVAEGDIGTGTTDSDYDAYALAFIYKFQGGQFGVLNFYLPHRGVAETVTVWNNYLAPYFKMQMGPVYLEGEASVTFGSTEYDPGFGTDVDRKGYNAYLYANVDLGQLYVGGTAAWVSGDDPSTVDENETGWDGGEDFDPCLILWNDNLTKWMGPMGTSATTNDRMTNALFFQVHAGMKPMDKLDVRVSYAMASADEKPLGYANDDYGTEFDITATYKIYDNLSYMVGFGYLWTGDYFKGANAQAELDDNYLIVNKLTLKF